MSDEAARDELIDDAQRLTRDMGDRGPSLAERLSERLDRLSFASPFHRMRLRGRFPLKIIAVPVDPVPGDPARGARLKGGRLFRDGFGQGMLDGRLDTPEAPAAWRSWVHGWGWLRDLKSVGPLSAAETARVEGLAKRWLARFHDYDDVAWAPAETGRRILMAIAYAPMVMPGSDHIHRSTLLNGIARWARHLDRAVPRMQPGFPKLEAVAGLIGAGLMLPGGEERLARAFKLLDQTLDALLGENGAPVSRCALELANIGDLMLLLTAFHTGRMQRVSAPVERALTLVRGMLSSLAMGDGLPPAWHGGRPDLAQMQRLEAATSTANPPRGSGFRRLSAGKVRVMVDAGPPPPARLNPQTHASTLSFVMTDGATPLIVNCGGERGVDGDWGYPNELVQGLRSTAGHSVLVLAETNSSRLPDGGPRRLGGVEQVVVECRNTPQGQWLEGWHDGWRRRFGYDHLRRLWLSPDGADLRGEDRLVVARQKGISRRPKEPMPIAIRFHLGPDVTATPTQDGRGALLVIASPRGGGGAWAFKASFNSRPGVLSVEPSLYVGPDGTPHEVQQILLTTMLLPGEEADIGWSLKRNA